MSIANLKALLQLTETESNNKTKASAVRARKNLLLIQKEATMIRKAILSESKSNKKAKILSEELPASPPILERQHAYTGVVEEKQNDEPHDAELLKIKKKRIKKI